MSAVDVLDRLLAFAARGVERDDPARETIEAAHKTIAAVAELIEAHRRLLDYVLSEAEAREYNPPADTKIIADSMAALARVRGGAA